MTGEEREAAFVESLTSAGDVRMESDVRDLPSRMFALRRFSSAQSSASKESVRCGIEIAEREELAALQLPRDQGHQAIHRLGSDAAQGDERLRDVLRVLVGHWCGDESREPPATLRSVCSARIPRVSSCGDGTAVRSNVRAHHPLAQCTPRSCRHATRSLGQRMGTLDVPPAAGGWSRLRTNRGPSTYTGGS